MKKIWIYLLVGLLLILVGAGGMYYLVTEKALFGQTVINKLEKEVTVNENGIADAVEKLYDAVVVVGSYKKGVLQSTGTGFVYKVDGNTAYILTNNHVVSGAETVKVKFTDNNIYDVEVVGADKYSDIAVLKINKDKIISIAEIGKSSASRLGDTLFTIGAPLDSESYSWTVTRGILSGKDRLVEVNDSSSGMSDWVMKVLQTDAAINAGNSGGPIANSNGQVIGITNMKLASTGVEGMGFAIPIEDAVQYAEMLIKNGKIDRPFLGVGTVNPSSTRELYNYGLSVDNNTTEGAIVVQVQINSVAASAGLQKGDIITKLGSYKITSTSYLKYYLYKYKVNDTISLTYVRNGKEETVSIKLTQKAD